VKDVLPLAARIIRAVFLGIAGWFILSVPFFLLFEETARAALWKHDSTDILFRAFIRLSAKSLGIGIAFLLLAWLVGKAMVKFKGRTA
jgi:hypothetical protein